jgi:hypothetical protein
MHAILLALILTLSGAVSAMAADTCSNTKEICEFSCSNQMGLANLDCHKRCNDQFASCLKTGVFKTRDVNKSGLEKK